MEQPNPDTSDNATLLQKSKTRTLLFDEPPEWAKDNEYILSGWRSETNSYWECIKSMGYIHNEAGNIYSHLFAAIWMVVLGSWWTVYAKDRYPATNTDDRIVFIFFLAGTVCYLLSTRFPRLCHSQLIHNKGYQQGQTF
jgi:adiponectin receptor